MSAVESQASEQKKVGGREWLFTFLTNVAIQGVTVIQGVVLARVLGSEGRGQFAAAILWPNFFAMIGIWGANVALARAAATTPSLAALRRTSLGVACITGWISTLACWLAGSWLLAGTGQTTWLAFLVFLPFVFFNHVALCLSAVDQGAGHFSMMNRMRLVLNPVYVLLILLSVLAGQTGVVWLVGCLLAANGVTALMRVGAMVREDGLRGPVLPVGPVLKQGLGFGFAGVAGALLQTADKALLLQLLGTEKLGIYTVALTAASVAGSVASASSTVGFGMAAQAGVGQGFETVARLFRLTSWLWLGAGLATAAGVVLLLPLIYGAEFAPARWPALALIGVVATGGQAVLLEEAMRAQGRAFVGIQGRLAGFGVLIVAGTLLAPKLDIMGVIVALTAAHVVILTVLVVSACRHFQDGRASRLWPRLGDLAELVNLVRRRLAGRVAT